MENKEEFIKGILEMAKKNIEKDEFLVQMLFLDTDKGMNIIGLLGLSDQIGLRDALAGIGKKYAKDRIKINTVFLLSDATSRKLPMAMADVIILEGKVPRDVIIKSAMETADTIIIAEWDLLNDYQVVTSQHYHKENQKIVYDGKPIKMEGAAINMLDSFVQNYKIIKL